MMRAAGVAVAAVLLGVRLYGQGPDIELQRAIQREMATGDLKRAIADYRRIADRAAARRNIAAQALLHLAEAYQKLGDADAGRVYEEIAAKYGDQANVASEARRRLAAASTGVRGSTLTTRLMWAGSDFAAQISRDGKQIPVTDWFTGDLAIRNVQTGSVRRLHVKKGDVWGTTSPESEQFVDASLLSPDQRQIAYSWYDDKMNGALQLVSVAPGAAPRTIVDDPAFLIYPYAFSSDGKSILVTRSRRERAATLEAGIGWVDMETSQYTMVKRLDRRGAGLRSYPALSPDGQWIAYAAHVSDDPAGASSVYVVSADGRSENEVASGGSINEGVAWTQDGKRLLFTSDRSGTFDLWSVAVAGGKATEGTKLVKAEIGRVYPLGTTTAGSYFYARGPRGSNVWADDLNSPKTPPARLSENAIGRNRAPAWSPDGKMVAFKRDRTGSQPVINDLIVKDLAAGTERNYGSGPTTAGGGRTLWFHDNASIGIGNSKGVGSVLRRLNLATGEWRDFAELTFRFATAFSALSPDDRILYALDIGTANGRRNTIMAAEIPSGNEQLVWKETADNINIFSIALSPDGRRLAFGRQRFAEDGGIKIVVINVDGSNPRELNLPGRAVSTNESSLAWTRNGQSIYFVQYAEAGTSTSSPQYRLNRIHIETGVVTPLDVLFNKNDFRMDVRMDDGAVAFSEETREQPTVWSLDNIDTAFTQASSAGPIGR